MASLVRTASTSRLLSAAKVLNRVVFRSASDKMSFTFVSANQIFYANESVKQVDVPSFSSSFGILPNHVPVLAVLKPGVVTVYEDGGASKKIFVSSGTVTVNEDSTVQILAEEAHLVADLDKSAAQQALTEAENELHKASTEVEKARAQIAVDTSTAVVQALS